MRLTDLQRALASSLTGRSAPPEGCDCTEIERARRSLATKRRRAAGHLLPRITRALGARWRVRFHDHVLTYVPQGLLYHVDDAWAFAQLLVAAADLPLRAAARDDLLALRLRYVRSHRAGAKRIRERRAPLLAVTATGRRALICRLPGAAGSVCRIPLGWRPDAHEPYEGPCATSEDKEE